MKPLCEEDDVDMFFKSIAMTAKKMSPLAMKKAKLRTLNLISEINDKYSTPQTAQTLLYTPIWQFVVLCYAFFYVIMFVCT
ncbi:BESS domain-containing protein [Aphis craccivora]|uniref:BESS domain-containing protein n=1 Tax=Aphis craccivora TaxID=307492 RepID=A0A6G0VV92_APHCR|nr:BESS domain-containing protein [Aphis craccivora]